MDRWINLCLWEKTLQYTSSSIFVSGGMEDQLLGLCRWKEDERIRKRPSGLSACTWKAKLESEMHFCSYLTIAMQRQDDRTKQSSNPEGGEE